MKTGASPARVAALKTLQACRKSGELHLPTGDLKPEDSRLAERIAGGVLQNEAFLDACLETKVPSGYRRLHPLTQDILRLSAYQLLFLDRVPASAVVNDAVTLCRMGKNAWQAGFVNAVLRQLAALREKLPKKGLPGAELTEQLKFEREVFGSELSSAVRYSHPEWLVNRLQQHFGQEFTEAYLRCNQMLPALRLQVNTLRCDPDEYLALLEAGTAEAIEVLSVNRELSSVLVSSTAVERLPGYAGGLFYVQDDAARYAVQLSGVEKGMRVLDVCAAPGGKSIAAALMGGEVLSCDISETRLRRCSENYKRLKLSIPVCQADATAFQPEWDGAFDAVIADVPCSGSGIIRKHPEIRRKTEAEFLNLLPIQRGILENASRYVRPGGVLLYATCSVLPEEDEEQIAAFLNGHAEFTPEPDSKDCYFRSWPQLDSNDGFFAAKLRKLQ